MTQPWPSVQKLSFSKQVEAFVEKSQQRMEFVFHESTIELVNHMQRIGPSTAYPGGDGGSNPVDTGWHRSHFEVSSAGLPQIDRNSKPPESEQGLGLHKYRWNREATYSHIKSISLGSTIYGGYTAGYADFLEYRVAKSSAFVRLAAQNWQQIVNRNAQKAIRAFP